MRVKNFFIGFMIISLITFVVAAGVSFLYTLIVHSTGIVDWDHAIRLALILGITIQLVYELEKKRKLS